MDSFVWSLLEVCAFEAYECLLKAFGGQLEAIIVILKAKFAYLRPMEAY